MGAPVKAQVTRTSASIVLHFISIETGCLSDLGAHQLASPAIGEPLGSSYLQLPSTVAQRHAWHLM